MNISVIDARDLSEAWFLCLGKVLTDGLDYRIERGSYAGERRKELPLVVVQINYPGSRPLVPDVPQGVPAPTTMEYIENYLPYLMTPHKAEGEQYTYGQYLERQIAEVIRMYKEEGFNTNQAFTPTVSSRQQLSNMSCSATSRASTGLMAPYRSGRVLK